MARINKECRDCHKPFSISDEEQAWLKERKLEEYTRCSECRAKNKLAKMNKKKVEAEIAKATVFTIEEIVQRVEEAFCEAQDKCQSDSQFYAGAELMRQATLDYFRMKV